MRWKNFYLLGVFLLCFEARTEGLKEEQRVPTEKTNTSTEIELPVAGSLEALRKTARELGYAFVESGGVIYLVPPGMEGDLYEGGHVIEVYRIQNPGPVEKKEIKRAFEGTRAGSGGT